MRHHIGILILLILPYPCITRSTDEILRLFNSHPSSKNEFKKFARNQRLNLLEPSANELRKITILKKLYTLSRFYSPGETYTFLQQSLEQDEISLDDIVFVRNGDVNSLWSAKVALSTL